MDLETAHLDGYRAEAVDEGNHVMILLRFYAGGEVQQEWPFRQIYEKPDGAHIPELTRETQLLKAIARFLTAGGNRDTVNFWGSILCELPLLESDMQLVAVESEETHVRTYLLPSGDYLRIIEDEVAETLRPHELLDHLDERDSPTPV